MIANFESVVEERLKIAKLIAENAFEKSQIAKGVSGDLLKDISTNRNEFKKSPSESIKIYSKFSDCLKTYESITSKEKSLDIGQQASEYIVNEFVAELLIHRIHELTWLTEFELNLSFYFHFT